MEKQLTDEFFAELISYDSVPQKFSEKVFKNILVKKLLRFDNHLSFSRYCSNNKIVVYLMKYVPKSTESILENITYK